MTLGEEIQALQDYYLRSKYAGVYTRNLYFDKESYKTLIDFYGKRISTAYAIGDKLNPLEAFAINVLRNTIGAK